MIERDRIQPLILDVPPVAPPAPIETPTDDIEALADLLHDARLWRALVTVCGIGVDARAALSLAAALSGETDAPGLPRLRVVSLSEATPLRLADRLCGLVRPCDLVVGVGEADTVDGALHQAADMGAVVARLSIDDLRWARRDLVDALKRRGGDRLPGLILAGGRGASSRGWTVGRCTAARGAVFLDRDGVINVNRGDYVKAWTELKLLPGAIEALRILAATPYPIVVVTNQSAVNRGLMTYEMAESINDRLMILVSARGGRIDAVAWCPHRPEEQCDCRKPRSGMLTYTAHNLNLDLGRSYLVGDAADDLAAGMAVGCETALVLTGRGRDQYEVARRRWGAGCRVYPDLAAAARWIAQGVGEASPIVSPA